MTFQILTAVSMKMTAFWDIAPCSVEIDRRLEVRTASIIGAMTEAVCISEKLVNFQQDYKALDPIRLASSISMLLILIKYWRFNLHYVALRAYELQVCLRVSPIAVCSVNSSYLRMS
jgi:hypothetical protein